MVNTIFKNSHSVQGANYHLIKYDTVYIISQLHDLASRLRHDHTHVKSKPFQRWCTFHIQTLMAIFLIVSPIWTFFKFKTRF